MNEDFRNAQSSLLYDISRNREFAEFHFKAGKDSESLDEVDKYRGEYLARLIVTQMMRSVQARVDGLLSNNDWLELQDRIQFAWARPVVRAIWPRIKNNFPKKSQELWQNNIAGWTDRDVSLG